MPAKPRTELACGRGLAGKNKAFDSPETQYGLRVRKSYRVDKDTQRLFILYQIQHGRNATLELGPHFCRIMRQDQSKVGQKFGS